MRFEFATATRIIFGEGAARDLGELAASLGKRALVITGRTPERVQPQIDSLKAHGIAVTPFVVAGEPTVELALDGVKTAKDAGCDLVVAIGGGSVLDAGKAIAALTTNPGDPYDYLEVIGKGQPITMPPLPVIAVPTTAGTGSEVTRNAVLASAEHSVKVSMRHPSMLPALAIVDPELTYDLPLSITASTGMDALTQVIEPYVCNSANPITDALCIEAIPRAARALPRLLANLHDHEARREMALASLSGGLALANAKLGAVHGFAGPLGGMFDAPHGAVCAALLPHVMAANIQALTERAPDSPILRRYQQIARWLTGREDASAADGMGWTLELCERLAIPPLRSYGISEADFPEIVEKSARSGSMKGNPIVLTADEMTWILAKSL